MVQGILKINSNASSVLQTVVEDFASATDFGAIIVDIHGKESSKQYNFSNFCTLIRSYKDFLPLCQKCDMYGGLEASKTGTPSIYRCHAGLTDLSLPIITQSQLSGFMMFGQVHVTDVDNDYFTRIQSIKSNWQDYPDLREAYDKVKIVSSKQIEGAASLIRKINEFHSDSASNTRSQIVFKMKSPTIKVRSQSQADSKSEIKKAIEYIHHHLNRQITLEEVADHVYLSQYYFSKLFKKTVGINFVAYLNQERIVQAKILLNNSTLSIDMISHNLGFSQTSYFCKLFKQATGETPAKYRKLKK